jgi:hypothetical protein
MKDEFEEIEKSLIEGGSGRLLGRELANCEPQWKRLLRLV